jgi:rhodanese-related sulfurtransferase
MKEYVTAGFTLPPVLRPLEVAELVQADTSARLLDVRSPGEYESVHISGAYNVPLDMLAEHAREIRTNVAEQIVLVCQSGQRARNAEEVLRAAGLENLHILDGGVNGWVAAGLPVVRGSKRLSLERQVRIVAGALAGVGGLLGVFVNPLFALIPAVVGSGLVFAGLTDNCALAMVLTRLPYNRPASCDVGAMVRALSQGDASPGVSRERVSARSRTCGGC